MKQSVRAISKFLLLTMCPLGNENNRHRAAQLIKSGSMQISTMQHKYVKSRLDSNLKISLFAINIAPSIKSKIKSESIQKFDDQLDDCSTLFLAFDTQIKKILFYPYSICGCYDGRHMHSYFAAFLYLIRCAQQYDCKQEDFEKSLPDNLIKLQNFIALIENIGLRNKRKKARKRNA